MDDRRVPVFRKLTQEEIEAILARNHVGRIAYSLRERVVDIEPIHYVYADGWIYGRTEPGTKLSAVGQNWWVAFEVDEIDGLFDWRSVVVHGGFYPLSPVGSEATMQVWEQALGHIRTLFPEALTPEDPVPFRWVLFRIAVQEATGRAASTVPADESGRKAETGSG
ncbi:MAG TPA: pyridoxamine 5'-phosphate oxidase family protein [Longimicrobiales bacterium]